MIANGDQTKADQGRAIEAEMDSAQALARGWRGTLELCEQIRRRDAGRRPCKLVTDDQEHAGAGFDQWASSPRGLTLAPGAHISPVRGREMEDKEKRDGRTTLREIFAVFKNPTLSGDEKALWMLYRAYDAGKGAWPGDEALAGHMGKGVRSVQGYRARLLEAGFLHKEFRGPKSAIYRTMTPEKASQCVATLDPPSLAVCCDARTKASQEASQDLASPLYRNTVSTEKTSIYEEGVLAVFDYWCAKRAKVLPPSNRKPKATNERLSKVKDRLADGYTVEELQKAVDGCLGSGFHVDGGHTDLELICRDEKHVDRFRAQARKNGNGSRTQLMTAAEVEEWAK